MTLSRLIASGRVWHCRQVIYTVACITFRRDKPLTIFSVRFLFAFSLCLSLLVSHLHCTASKQTGFRSSSGSWAECRRDTGSGGRQENCISPSCLCPHSLPACPLVINVTLSYPPHTHMAAGSTVYTGNHRNRQISMIADTHTHRHVHRHVHAHKQTYEVTPADAK